MYIAILFVRKKGGKNNELSMLFFLFTVLRILNFGEFPAYPILYAESIEAPYILGSKIWSSFKTFAPATCSKFTSWKLYLITFIVIIC